MLFTGELLKQAERYTQEGLHPRMITEGYEVAKEMVLEFLEAYKREFPNISGASPVPLHFPCVCVCVCVCVCGACPACPLFPACTNPSAPPPPAAGDRELLMNVARTSLRTKLSQESADNMASAVVDAIRAISEDDVPIDLHMVEIMTMQHKSGSDSQFINGLVLDHGARHPDMPTKVRKQAQAQARFGVRG